MTPEEQIVELEAGFSPAEIEQARAEAAQGAAPPPSVKEVRDVGELEAGFSPDEINQARQEAINISIPTDEVGNAAGEPGLLSDVRHGVLNVANATVRDTADFAMSLFDLPLFGAQKAAELFTNTPQEEIDAFDKNVDFTDRMDEILTGLGVTEEQPAQSNLEQGALNVAPALATSVSTFGVLRPAIRAIEKDFMRFLRPDAKGVLAGGAVESGVQAFKGGGESKEAEIAGAVTALAVGGFSELAESARDLTKAGTRKSIALASDFNRGQQDIAGSAIQQSLGDEAARGIAQVEDLAARPGFSDLTPGQLTENRALQELEREIIMRNPAAKAEFEQQQLGLQDWIRAKIRGSETGPDVPGQEFIAQYLKGAERAIERLQTAERMAIEEWARVVRESPKIDDDFGTPLKKIFLENQERGRKIEKAFWAAAVLDDVPVKSPAMDKLFKTVTDVMAEAGEADVAKGLQRFPDENLISLMRSWKARTLPGKPDPLGISRGRARARPENATVSADALINARSNFLDDAAEAMASGNKSLARRNYAIADALLDSITSADPNVPNAYDVARNYSRFFNDNFNRSIIGPMLSKSKHRDARVPANEVLEKFIAPGERGRTNIQVMKAANGGVVPEVAKQGILTDMMRAGGVDPMKGPDLTNVPAMESWAASHAKMLIEADMVEDAKRFITFARQQQLSLTNAAEAATAIGKSPAARVLKQYGGTPEKLSSYVTTLFTANAKNPGDSIKDLFFTFDLLAPNDLSPGDIAIARQGLRSIVTNGVLDALFHSTVDASKVNPRVATRHLGQRITAALESTGQWSTGDIDRLSEAFEVLRLQHAGNPLRVKDAAGGSRLPGEISAALETSILGRVSKLAVLRHVAPKLTKGTQGASIAIAGEVGKFGTAAGEKLAQFVGPTLDANGAGDLLIMSLFDKDLWAALAKREIDLTPADVGLIRSAAWKIAKNIGKATAFVATSAARRPGVTAKVLETLDTDPQEEQQ